MTALFQTSWPRLWWRRAGYTTTVGEERCQIEQPSPLAQLNLTDDDVAAFNMLYEQLSGSRLDQAAARDKATALLLFVQALTSPPAKPNVASGGGDD